MPRIFLSIWTTIKLQWRGIAHYYSLHLLLNLTLFEFLVVIPSLSNLFDESRDNAIVMTPATRDTGDSAECAQYQ